jgi:hypothetical protein
MLEANPPNASISIRPNKIRIPFDEYIKLNNPSKNITVVPELPTKPKFEVKGKELLITLESDELLENTTYSFVFNRAISDLNEGNDTTFTFVFSTGQYIDSLSHEVLLIDAESLSPISNATVALFFPYDTLDPYNEKPKYIAQTNKEGLAVFEYLGQQEFLVFAYDSKGASRLSPDTPIAFRTDNLILDTVRKRDTLFMFVPEPEITKARVLQKRVDYPGRIGVRTNFSLSPEDVRINIIEHEVPFIVERTSFTDSAIFWFRAIENSAYDVLIPFADTVLNARVSTRKLIEKKPSVIDNLIKDELGIHDMLTLIFDFPISDVLESGISVFHGDEQIDAPIIEVYNLRSLKIIGDFIPDVLYKILILPNTVQFYDDSFYSDSIQLSFKRLGANKYANLELVLEDIPKTPLLIQLISNSQVIAEQRVLDNQETLIFNLLPPGEYMVKVVLDSNENGRWDTGSWVNKTQAEEVIWFRQTFTLRANWDTKQPLKFLK